MARPSFQATDEQRRMVKSLAAYGIKQDGIAKMLGLSSRTLRKHFRDELDRGGLEANSQVAQALFKKAVAGNTTAQIFWLKCRSGWREGGNSDAHAAPVPDFVVALKREPS
jgi:transposase